MGQFVSRARIGMSQHLLVSDRRFFFFASVGLSGRNRVKRKPAVREEVTAWIAVIVPVLPAPANPETLGLRLA